VRLIGIDAPQEDLRPSECHSSEATTVVRELLPVGSEVRYTLGADPSDLFERALAHVWLADGALVNLEMIKRGAARVMIDPPNLEYQALLNDAAVWAAMNRRGLWNEC
jgi:micrococcal nuclease